MVEKQPYRLRVTDVGTLQTKGAVRFRQYGVYQNWVSCGMTDLTQRNNPMRVYPSVWSGWALVAAVTISMILGFAVMSYI
jgi:hypothetical protein